MESLEVLKMQLLQINLIIYIIIILDILFLSFYTYLNTKKDKHNSSIKQLLFLLICPWIRLRQELCVNGKNHSVG